MSDLLGGAVRDQVPFSAYLFYKWAAHPGQAPDAWGAALDPAGDRRPGRADIAEYGFTAIKLKGGVFAPEQEVEAMRALRAEFPGHPLRIDPTRSGRCRPRCGWPPSWTACWSTWRTRPAVWTAMAEVARQAPMPLATNMCVVAFEDISAASSAAPSAWCSPTTTTGAG